MSVYWSYRTELVQGVYILPDIKEQWDLNSYSCSHHAIAAALESRKKKQWAEMFGELYNHEASVFRLIEECPPPKSSLDVMEYVVFRGVISEYDYLTNVPFRQAEWFRIDSYRELHPGAVVEDRAEVVQELLNHGPVVACYTMRDDFHARRGDVYEVRGLAEPFVYRGQSTDLRHASCIIGFGWDEDDYDSDYFEVQDSLGDIGLLGTPPGFDKILMSVVDTVYVPVMVALDDEDEDSEDEDEDSEDED